MIQQKTGFLPKVVVTSQQLSSARKLVGTIVIIALATGLLYYVELMALPYRQYFRYLTILPVTIMAFLYGPTAGLGMAVFYSTALLPQTLAGLRTDPLGTHNIQIYTYILFINTLAYIVADFGRSNRKRRDYSSTVQDWQGLLARTSALDEVVKFILKKTTELCPAEQTVFLLRSPVEGHWEVVTLDDHQPLPIASVTTGAHQSLAEWLLEQERAVLLNHLDQDDTILLSRQTGSSPLTSLLGLPLYHQDGTLMGVLVLINKTGGDFSDPDLRNLRNLIAGGEKALEQAGQYARTDYALAKRVRQLAVIQRTARELNATLDPQQIIERTLECALDIADGEAGFISLDMGGFQPIYCAAGVSLQPTGGPQRDETLRRIQEAALSKSAAIPTLLPKPAFHLNVPILRENQTLGIIIVESTSTRVFKEAATHVLTLLADHAATALENARLFREIQMEQERASLIVHAIADGLFTTDASGRVTSINPAAEQLTGWEQNECQGKYFYEILGYSEPGVAGQSAGQDSRSNVYGLSQAVQDRQTLAEKIVIRQRTGTQRVISLNMAPLPAMADSLAGFVFLIRDITEQEEMDRLQRELIAAISHEIRAPLSHISTIAETLVSENEADALRPYRKYIDNLTRQTQRMVNFADRIQDVYRMQTGRIRLQLRPLPASLLVEEVVRQWQAAYPAYKFLMQASERSLWMWADESAFQNVLNNLLENAVKYSLEGTTITVTIRPADPGMIAFLVQDQGSGIAAEHQNKIFQMFYRVDGRDAQTVYGHGFGLYIAKNLVERMDGRIWVESEPGQGSTFTFSLPIMEDNNAGKDFTDR